MNTINILFITKADLLMTPINCDVAETENKLSLCRKIFFLRMFSLGT